jgi:hypothetical protein
MAASLAAQTEPPAPAQPAIIQQDTPAVLTEEIDAELVDTEPPEIEPPAPAQPAVIQQDTPPVLTAEAEAELRSFQPPAQAQPVAAQQEAQPCVPEPVKAKPQLKHGRSKSTAQIPPPPHSSAFVLPAGFVSTSSRDGYRKYNGVLDYQHIERRGMFMYGGAVGKRFALKNRTVRFQAAAEAGWGSVNEEAYEYETDDAAEEVNEYLNLSTFGIQADMHVLFPAKTRAYFLSAGAGLHRSSISFSMRGSGNQVLWKGDNMVTLSPSFNVGAGLEYTMGKYRAAALTYNFRIWSPVRYIESGDLFPMGVHYEEFFYTHSFNIQLLLPGTKKGSFR